MESIESRKPSEESCVKQREGQQFNAPNGSSEMKTEKWSLNVAIECGHRNVTCSSPGGMGEANITLEYDSKRMGGHEFFNSMKNRHHFGR